MSKYPKNLLLYRQMNSLLNWTDLIKNLIAFRNYYLGENYENWKFTWWVNWKYKNNFHTAQSIELLREVILWSWFWWRESIENKDILARFIDTYSVFKWILTKKDLKNCVNKKRKILFKLSHQQFWYQKLEYHMYDVINYYYNFYQDKDINKYIEEKLWISYIKLIWVWFLLVELAKNNIYLDLYSDKNIYKDKIKFIIDKFSIKLEDLKHGLKESYSKSDIFNNIQDIEYHGSEILFTKPLIIIGNKFFCPIPLLLLNRITHYIYYDFDEDFKKDILWAVNQKFIYSLIERNINKKLFNIYYTEDFLGNYKTTPPNPDIIIEWKDSLLFIECKTNWLSFTSTKWDITDKDYEDKIKKNIRQVFKSLAYFDGLKEWEDYFWIKKSNKKVISVIIYNKNPYLWFWNYMNDIVNDIITEWKISEFFIKNNIPLILESLSILDFICIINGLWFDWFMKEISNSEYDWWELEWILNEILSRYKIKDKHIFEKNFVDYLEEEEKRLLLNSNI